MPLACKLAVRWAVSHGSHPGTDQAAAGHAVSRGLPEEKKGRFQEEGSDPKEGVDVSHIFLDGEAIEKVTKKLNPPGSDARRYGPLSGRTRRSFPRGLPMAEGLRDPAAARKLHTGRNDLCLP